MVPAGSSYHPLQMKCARFELCSFSGFSDVKPVVQNHRSLHPGFKKNRDAAYSPEQQETLEKHNLFRIRKWNKTAQLFVQKYPKN